MRGVKVTALVLMQLLITMKLELILVKGLLLQFEVVRECHDLLEEHGVDLTIIVIHIVGNDQLHKLVDHRQLLAVVCVLLIPIALGKLQCLME